MLSLRFRRLAIQHGRERIDGAAPEARQVVEILGLAESELAEYCRRSGGVEQILQWRTVCMQATSAVPERTAAAVPRRGRSCRRIHY